MIGAIIGDIIGSRFEKGNRKTKDFELFDKGCRLTDCSVMSFAIAQALLKNNETKDRLSLNALECSQELCKVYPQAGYNKECRKWIYTNNPPLYGGYGNWSATRISPCGFAASNINEAKELSLIVTQISHSNHEAIKGAEAITSAIFMARDGKNKEYIKNVIANDYYNLDFTIDGIRKYYSFNDSCQNTVPVAIVAFLESISFEDAIRTAISVGGNSKAVASMTGSIAEAYYGVPKQLVDASITFLDSKLMEILYYFEKKHSSNVICEKDNTKNRLFDVLDNYVDKIPSDSTMEIKDLNLSDVPEHGYAYKDILVPDFSSFDNKHSQNKAGIILAKAGSEVAKAAEKVGHGFLAAVKFAKYNIDIAKDRNESNIDYCFEIIPQDSEDTESIIDAVDRLKQTGFAATVNVSGGSMHGYVIAKKKELEMVNKTLETNEGTPLRVEQLDKSIADTIKKNIK